MIADEFYSRARTALDSFLASPELMERVNEGVNLFFKKYPSLIRTPHTEGYVTSLLIEQFSSGADSQSVPHAETQTQKAA